jgi:hypothetical protein
MITQTFTPVAGAQQGEFECRQARRLRGQRAGGQGTQLPARFGGAGAGPRAGAREEKRCSGNPRRENQPPAGSEIIGRGLAPEFEKHRPEAGAARGLEPRLQCGGRIPRVDHQEARGVCSEFAEPWRMRKAGFAVHRLVPHPEKGAVLGENRAASEHEAAQRWNIRHAARMELMQARTRQRRARDAGRGGFPCLAWRYGPCLPESC